MHAVELTFFRAIFQAPLWIPQAAVVTLKMCRCMWLWWCNKICIVLVVCNYLFQSKYVVDVFGEPEKDLEILQHVLESVSVSCVLEFASGEWYPRTRTLGLSIFCWNAFEVQNICTKFRCLLLLIPWLFTACNFKSCSFFPSVVLPKLKLLREQFYTAATGKLFFLLRLTKTFMYVFQWTKNGRVKTISQFDSVFRYGVIRSTWLLQWDSIFWKVCLLKLGLAKSSALGAAPSVSWKQSESAVTTSFLPLGRLSDRNERGPFSLEFSLDLIYLGSDLPPFCWTFGRLCTSRSSRWFLETLVSTFKWGWWGASDVASVGLKARGWAMCVRLEWSGQTVHLQLLQAGRLSDEA